MKKYGAVYCEDSITYWPQFSAGIAMICFVAALLSVALTLFVFSLISGDTTDNIRIQIVVLIVLLFWATIFIVLSVRSMYTRIHVTNDGVSVCNLQTKKGRTILWDDVSAIYFYQDNWYGRKSYKIHLKSSTSNRFSSSCCDFIIPIHAVSEEILHNFIPKNLLKNNPRDSN